MEKATATLDLWLGQFPAQVQPLIVAWFAYAAGQGAPNAEALLQIVERVVGHKLDWSVPPPTRQLCRVVLLALCHQRGAARAFACTFLPQQELV
jgi:hypothetical protein